MYLPRRALWVPVTYLIWCGPRRGQSKNRVAWLPSPGLVGGEMPVLHPDRQGCLGTAYCTRWLLNRHGIQACRVNSQQKCMRQDDQHNAMPHFMSAS